MYQKLFGSSGIRGDAKELFTDQFCFDIGRVFGLFLKNHTKIGKVAIGIDPRESSPRIRDWFSRGIFYEGFEVVDQGCVPIPAINYILIANTDYRGSCMVTGSHIKSSLNGIKFFVLREEISKEHEEEITNIYHRIKNDVKKISRVIIKKDTEAQEKYSKYLKSLAILPFDGVKIVVDSGNGTQSEVMPKVLKELGCKVIEFNCDLQELLMSRDTEVDTDFADLQKMVPHYQADLGVGYDSDGDRAIFVDHEGNLIPGDYTGTIIAKYKTGEGVVTPVNTSSVIDSIGKTVIRTKVGSPHVVKAMKDYQTQFGFEANGGGIFDEMKSRDGGRTTIEILNLMKKGSKSLKELMAELPKRYLHRSKIEYPIEMKEFLEKKIQECYGQYKVDVTDGFKFYLTPHDWILFRSSMNAAEYRVFTESTDNQKSLQLLDEGLELLKTTLKHE